MLAEFKNHIKNRFPNLLQDRFLLACSGGIDSMVLTDLCVKLGLNFELAHCNFRLRGGESDEDEEFAVKSAQDMDKKIHITNFDTIGYMNKYKVSLQVAARVLRYRWFTEIMQKQGIKFLVTAHHADDNLETFLINLSRGTGIDGLTGIPEKTDTICRPLLPFSRERIMAYAKTEKLKWREDSSNSDTKYLRNKIRKEVSPLLKELHANFLSNFQNTQSRLAETAAISENHIERVKAELFTTSNEIVQIDIERLSTLKPLRGYLYGLFKDYGFTEWNNVEALLSTMSGKEVRSATHRLLKDRDLLLLTQLTTDLNVNYEIQENQSFVANPIRIRIESTGGILENDKSILYVDKKALKYPLTLRKWKKGDYFYPLGMGGRKKLSKFFKDEKVDVISKEKQWLLCSAEAIVWVIGKRADARFKVSEKTSEILKFELK